LPVLPAKQERHLPITKTGVRPARTNQEIPDRPVLLKGGADMASFLVTEKSMRPASDKRQCFYCVEPIGGNHKTDCVLVRKKVKVRMTVEYFMVVPAFWNKKDIEFHLNESSWCANNALDDLEKQFTNEDDECMCHAATFKYLHNDLDSYIDEIGC